MKRRDFIKAVPVVAAGIALAPKKAKSLVLRADNDITNLTISGPGNNPMFSFDEGQTWHHLSNNIVTKA